MILPIDINNPESFASFTPEETDRKNRFIQKGQWDTSDFLASIFENYHTMQLLLFNLKSIEYLESISDENLALLQSEIGKFLLRINSELTSRIK